MLVAGSRKEIHRRPKPLTDVRAKLRRAAQHISEIEAYIRSRQVPHRVKEKIQVESNEPGVAARFSLPTPIDDDLPMMVGEAIQSLRAALDYLVYDLAWIDGGQVPQDQDRTLFPIVERPEGFAKAAKTALKGLNSQHCQMLQAVQPYNGCNWTPLLQRYSNRDKHRHPVAVTWSGNCPFEADLILNHRQQGSGANSEDACKIRLKLKADAKMTNAGVGDRVDLRITSGDAQGHRRECCSAENAELSVIFDGAYYLPDGRPVLETLRLLLDGATKLVAQFEAELRAARVI